MLLAYGSGRVTLGLVVVVASVTALMQILVALDKFEAKRWPFFVSDKKAVEIAGAVWYACGALFCFVLFLLAR